MSVGVWMCETCAVCMYEDVQTNDKNGGLERRAGEVLLESFYPCQPSQSRCRQSGNHLREREAC